VATAGPFDPAVGESVTSGDANEVAWTNPQNIQTGAEAQVTAATFDNPDPTFYLVGRGYGFTIPAGSTIDGITVTVNRRSIIASSGIDQEIRLRDANGALIGDNKASATVWPTSLTDATYGGVADTWNTGLSATNLLAMVNDADFGVFFQARANIANADIAVARIQLTVTYTPPAFTPHTRSPADSFAFVDARTKTVGKLRADAIGFVDARAQAIGKLRADGFALVDARALARGKALADALALVDQATPVEGGGAAPEVTRVIRVLV
jgi:hypothetical protein